MIGDEKCDATTSNFYECCSWVNHPQHKKVSKWDKKFWITRENYLIFKD